MDSVTPFVKGVEIIPDGSVVRTGTNYSGKFQEAHDASKASIQSRISNLESGGVKGTGKALLTNEGKVGTYKQLVKQGTAFDNITPHHMPSAEKMKQAGIKRNDGVSMNMEQPHPETGGRHRETYTYGLSGKKSKAYLNLSFRDALAHDILDARRIYIKDGLHTAEIREGLREVIKRNKELYPHLFDK
ncbi:hypothetical protein [Bacillus thuringiensis]|uniref:hypothetical protein n=1 Tax=Bacillus thuringiensis TaxID=1428 RepID=UPI002FBEE03F